MKHDVHLKDEDNNFAMLNVILTIYLVSLNQSRIPKCYIKSTGQAYSGQIYCSEGIGMHDGMGNQVEYR